jgi:hypothetical protein
MRRADDQVDLPAETSFLKGCDSFSRQVEDIVAALGWQGERAMREAEALREYVASRGGPVKDNEPDGFA